MERTGYTDIISGAKENKMFKVTVLSINNFETKEFSSFAEANKFFFEKTGDWTVRTLKMTEDGEQVNWMARATANSKWTCMDL